MSSSTIILIVAGALCLALIAYYNAFVSRRNMARQAFSTIDVMLKKRGDLIPNLVAIVRQYMVHESSTLARIAELRSRIADGAADPGERVAADNEFSRLFGGIELRAENYPELKSNHLFLNLQRTLSTLEEQLSAARRTYNAAVTLYNNSVEMFPGFLLAGLFGFKRQELLETPPEERRSPDIRALLDR